ncbi:MAG: hypothetical protein J6Y20_00940 [Lachnospiraceae bacterium]|nr:hypothetical protein [Lachnospiraceae bacterium]
MERKTYPYYRGDKYHRELTPQEVSAYDLVAGGKEADAEMLSKLVGIEAELFYEKEKRPELEDTYEYIHAACEALAKATGIEELCSAEKIAPTMVLTFTVKRRRFSVTQAVADVYCNGVLVTSFGDNPEIIEPGEKYYGVLAGSWASKTPDAKFIHATLFHKYDDLYHVSDGVQKIIDREIVRETENAKRRT